MSRSATRARKRARTAATRRKSLEFLDHMRGAEFSATGAHSSLGLLAAENLVTTRATVSAAYGAKPCPAELPHTPARRAPKPSDMPQRSIWQAATGEPTPAPVPDIPDGARPATAPTPVKVGDLPEQAKNLAKIAKDKGLLSREWLSLGGVERDGKTVHVYARLHGNSVRYAVEN
ncbi:hypothetical protein [Streptomyces sp. NPDC057002]|uniref:hypothetical protein n=1 Tax=Streptomyces sp. NPDC057002 TaxID=3345992 RepID=UPI00362CB062